MIETLITALAFGTVWFWIIALVASVIIIASVEHEHYPTPSIVAILLGAIYWKAIVALPWHTILIAVLAFVLAGVLWSTFNWYRFCSKKSAKYREKYGDALTESQMNDLKSELLVSQHKAMLTGWIAFWPWSLFWSLTGDFFNMLYDGMVNVYQNIANRAMGKFTVIPTPKIVRNPTKDNDNYGRNPPGSY